MLLLILTSCSSSDYKSREEPIIPDDNITAKDVESPIIDDKQLNIAILAPLSKQKESIGHSLINSSQLAIMDLENPNLNLIPIDSEIINSNPRLLLKELEERRVKIILGPVYSSETEKLITLLNGKEISILSLSNDASINDPSTIIVGISPSNQADILTRHAISQGITNFHLLLPNTKYGKLIDEAVNQVVSIKDNITQSSNWYNSDNIDQVMEDLVISLKGSDNIKNAIYMPQGGINLSKLNNYLLKHNVKIRLIGSQAWDHPNILKFNAFNQAIFIRTELENDKFHHDFQKFFLSKPTNLDLIIYNTLTMISNMNSYGLEINKQNIINNNQEIGKYSSVKFNSQGIAMYKMSIIQIDNGSFKFLDHTQ
jgi:hypothetical protein